ncbi:phosphotransferase enzyme family-domain-containing protein [Echria macrotheca]|uniref:Phosphotransferase enzyme family-domain-containing protein n=1 Tax=Echria macrotheca TaxID=438768 RepID=A0AAJ0B6B3_9PEZI|nr:phosphotransferase enzyme family-domain-containing protein [Echria macrotheca]
MAMDISRPGLGWDGTGPERTARWTSEPTIASIAAVARRHLGIPASAPDSACTVSFHAAGAFSRLYVVDSPSEGGQFIMRVSLPVDPARKTRGEVATLQLVRRRTDLPVPGVVAFDDTSGTEIGFEWVLMELMPGRNAYYRWRRMDMAQKETLVVRVADLQAQLYRCGSPADGGFFRGIGTLGTATAEEEDDDEKNFRGKGGRGVVSMLGEQQQQPGQIVSSVFFEGPHYHYAVPRGPFRCSHDWLRAHLLIIIKEHTTSLAGSRDSDHEKEQDSPDREYAEGVLRVARKLLRLLPKIFPSIVHLDERTVLWHDQLSLMNMLVDDNGRLTAIIDWECIATVPRWVASQMPEFLRGAVREEKPDRSRYTDVVSTDSSSDETGTEDDDSSVAGGGGGRDGLLDDSLDNEGKTELYWIHLMEYEQTQLRKVYSARMRLLRPGWDADLEEAALKVDFLDAVLRCNAGFYLKRLEQWVDAVERREYVRLAEVLRIGIRKERAAKGKSSTR